MSTRTFAYIAGLLTALHSSVVWAQAGSGFVPITPCRVVNTGLTSSPLGGPSLVANSSRSFPILSGPCDIPANASAYSVNVTAVPKGFLGYITIWPTGVSMPIVSTLNSYLGQVIANAAIVPAGTGGAISVFTTDPTDLLIDVDGYFLPPSVANTQSTSIGTGASSAGAQNTAIGFNALTVNSIGNGNTATGSFALSNNTSGSNNVAIGTSAMGFNAVGSANTAVGTQALLNNLIGTDNTALGFNALWENTTGIDNTGSGAGALSSNTTGSYNTALGDNALSSNVSGSYNTGFGYQAGMQITGSYNIDIGNHGQSTDSNTIRIGDPLNQTSAYIAGISGVTIVNGSQVLVNSNGQLGVVQSSRRYKEDIQDMGSASDALMLLRPVTFRYKKPAGDGTNPVQYGLIAEEVEKIFPQLVVHNKDGQVESVQYHELPALLLNELQKQHRTIQQQDARIAEQEQQLRALQDRLSELEKLLREQTTPGNRPTN